jgi:predicted dehydrogenase
MEPVRVAIVGCGGIAAFTHLPQLLNDKDTASISYLCDVKESRMDSLCERYKLGSIRCTTNYHEVLEDPSTDAVILAAWPAANALMAIDFLGSDKHLLLQKPFLLPSAADQAKLLKWTAQPGRQVLALPYIEPLDQFSTLKSRIENGQLGEIQFVRIRTTIPGPDDYYADVRRLFGEGQVKPPYRTKNYARQRGCLSDMGPYALAAFHFLFGGAAKCVASVMSSPAYEDLAILTLMPDQPQGGALGRPPIAKIEVGWSQIGGIELCGVYGSRGTLCIEPDGRTVMHTTSVSDEIVPAGVQAVLPLSPFRAQKEWLSAISRGQGARFQHTVERAIWVAGIIEDAYKKRITPP